MCLLFVSVKNKTTQAMLGWPLSLVKSVYSRVLKYLMVRTIWLV